LQSSGIIEGIYRYINAVCVTFTHTLIMASWCSCFECLQ